MDLMAARRRLLMQKKGGGLPSEYQQIAWLGATGTQYIATDYVPARSGLKAEWKYMLSANFSGDKMMWGTKSSLSNRTRIYAELYNQNNWYNAIDNVQYRNLPTYNGKTVGEIYTVSMDSTALTVNGTSVSPNGSYTDAEVPAMYIFAWNSGNNTAQYLHTALRLYGLSFFENGVKAADFVPCIRKADSVAGMYNTVAQKFYTNAGSGTFEVPT